MALQAGTRLGPYEIVAPLGAGGMGEVYRARDTRLDRTVAIKVLPEHLSSDPQRRMRFQREAKTISGLSHANICALYDVGEQDGVHYLVLEYLEGQVLAEKLHRGPLPIVETLKIGAEIAAGLDTAHRHGVVHRDLKPANVMLTKSGAKLLDFGLAKPAQAVAAAAARDATTISKSLTEEGVILGTFQYMAPEQIEGQEADPRSDIFALGLVLYEMASGKPAFQGKSRASLIGAIMHADPTPISQLQPLSPLTLEHLVQSCLAKDPEQRIQSAHDVMVELKWIADTGSQVGVASSLPVRKKRAGIGYLVAAIAVAVITFAAGWYWPRKAPPQAPVLRAVYPPPAGQAYVSASTTVSPDGSKIAFETHDDKTGSTFLGIRDLATGTDELFPETDMGTLMFWSPDSRALGYRKSNQLFRMDLETKASATIANLTGIFTGAAWSRSGMIVLALGNKIFTVPATGGDLTMVLNDTSAVSDSILQFLPDGHHFLAGRVIPGQTGIYVLDLNSSDQKFLFNVDTWLQWAAPGYLLFDRGGALKAQRFDPAKLEVQGEPFTVQPNIAMDFSASDNGILGLVAGENGSRKMGWWTRGGKPLNSVPLPADTSLDITSAPRVSPDGTNVAVALKHSQRLEQWVLNTKRGTWSRLTFGEGEDAISSMWSPDGREIAFALDRNVDRNDEKTDIVAKNVSGVGGQELLLAGPPIRVPTDWSADGKYLIYSGIEGGKQHLGYLDMSSRKTTTLLNTPFAEFDGRVSPDGRWLAYGSNESGQAEVYVVSFPNPAVKVPISSGGGYEPVWSRDGRELFYVKGDQTVMAVPVSANGSELRAGTPVALFKAACPGCMPLFDVSPDGKQFLIVTSDTKPAMTVISNWTALLKK